MSMTQAVQQAQTERHAGRAARSKQMQTAAEKYKQANPRPAEHQAAELAAWRDGLALAMAKAWS